MLINVLLKVLVLVLFKVFVHVFVPGCCTCSISFTCSFTSTLHLIRIGIYTYCLLGLALRIVFVHALVLSQGQVLVPGCFTSSGPFFACLGLFTYTHSCHRICTCICIYVLYLFRPLYFFRFILPVLVQVLLVLLPGPCTWSGLVTIHIIYLDLLWGLYLYMYFYLDL